jgi:hypothetical protein
MKASKPVIVRWEDTVKRYIYETSLLLVIF